MPPRYISRDELAEIIRNGHKAAQKDYLIVDVRDDDFVGGNIKNARNVPSNDFLRLVDGLVRDTKHLKLVVFHCALSQQRGPKAARIYHETLSNVCNSSESVPEVVILKDGFSMFQLKYKDDAELVENWDKDVWDSEWS